MQGGLAAAKARRHTCPAFPKVVCACPSAGGVPHGQQGQPPLEPRNHPCRGVRPPPQPEVPGHDGSGRLAGQPRLGGGLCGSWKAGGGGGWVCGCAGMVPCGPNASWQHCCSTSALPSACRCCIHPVAQAAGSAGDNCLLHCSGTPAGRSFPSCAVTRSMAVQQPSDRPVQPSAFTTNPPAICRRHPQGPYELEQEQQELEGGAAPHWRQRRAATGVPAFHGLRCHVAAAVDPPFKRADVV